MPTMGVDVEGTLDCGRRGQRLARYLETALVPIAGLVWLYVLAVAARSLQ